eukprot:6569408-Prymnesium_polylepis.1
MFAGLVAVAAAAFTTLRPFSVVGSTACVQTSVQAPVQVLRARSYMSAPQGQPRSGGDGGDGHGRGRGARGWRRARGSARGGDSQQSASRRV